MRGRLKYNQHLQLRGEKVSSQLFFHNYYSKLQITNHYNFSWAPPKYKSRSDTNNSTSSCISGLIHKTVLRNDCYDFIKMKSSPPHINEVFHIRIIKKESVLKIPRKTCVQSWPAYSDLKKSESLLLRLSEPSCGCWSFFTVSMTSSI